MRKLLALTIIVLIFFPLVGAAITVLSLNPWILDRNFYISLLSDPRLYDELLDEELPARFNDQVLPEVDQLPVSALAPALREVVTTDYLREQATTITNNIFDFIDGRVTSVEVYLDLMPIKALIGGEARPRFAQTLAASLPACSAGQEPIAPGGSVYRCIPSGTGVDEAAAVIEDALPRLLETAPSRISLGEPLRLEGADWFLGATIRRGLNQAIGYLIAATAITWLIAGFVAGSTWRERMFWLGVPLLLVAIPTFLIGLSLSSEIASAAVRGELSNSDITVNGMTYTPGFESALASVIGGALISTGNTLIGIGAVLSLAGMGLFIAGLVQPSARKRGSPTVTIPTPGEKPKRREDNF
ncbi:MAG: hypothetical protein HXY41_13050 [Chloroflexi bacterium]|nr:hypothetical protein [Chloroflexota bacterium]